MASSDELIGRPEPHVTFGVWTVGNRGRDPFGFGARPPIDPVHAVHRPDESGAYGVNFHHDDLVPFGSTAVEREQVRERFQPVRDETGPKVPMATTKSVSQPVFQDGSSTASDPPVRREALDARDSGHARPDQLVNELLLGLR